MTLVTLGTLTAAGFGIGLLLWPVITSWLMGVFLLAGVAFWRIDQYCRNYGDIGGPPWEMRSKRF